MIPMKKWLFPLYVTLLTCIISAYAYAESPDNTKLKNLNKGIFIVANEQLDYTSLRHTVIYVIQHDDAGTSGIIINRPTNLTINEAFPEVKASEALNQTLNFGGPLHTQYLFMLTQTKFTHGLFEVSQGVYFGTGDELKMRLQAEKTIDKTKVFGGFISWGPGQLENDILKGNWIITPGNPDEIFSDNAEKLWAVLHDRWAGSWI